MMTLIEAVGMRQRILNEATRLFARSGYSAISMREISAACGITKAALYYHFKDKEDLIVDILTENLAEISRLLEACWTTHTTTRARLTAFIQAIFALPVENRAIIRLASQEMPNLSSQVRLEFSRSYQDHFIGPLAGLLEEGMRSSELRSSDSHQAVWVLLGMMYPFFYPGEERPANLDSAVQLMITVFLDGMVKRD
jgi:AcrR family transcriptional regulator